MAKKQKRAKNNQGVANVVMEVNPNTPIYYVNNFEITSTPYDFTMAVAQLPPKLAPEQFAKVSETGTLNLAPLLQLTFPPSLLPGIIRMLTIQRENYEKVFGAIPEDIVAQARNSPRDQ